LFCSLAFLGRFGLTSAPLLASAQFGCMARRTRAEREHQGSFAHYPQGSRNIVNESLIASQSA
jgi:hypothetical protein